MADLPVPDDLGIFDIPEKVHGELILCRDLARFLRCRWDEVTSYAKDRQCLHRMQWARCKYVYYVSPFTAARIIVYVRAMQEERRQQAARVKRDRKRGPSKPPAS
jgi:hypothetical protein